VLRYTLEAMCLVIGLLRAVPAEVSNFYLLLDASWDSRILVASYLLEMSISQPMRRFRQEQGMCDTMSKHSDAGICEVRENELNSGT
jgi:hypothetical protein